MLVLTENHLEAISYLLEGKNTSEVAKLCNVSRTAIYNWLSDSNFKAALEKRKQEIKTTADKKLAGRLEGYLDELHKIATTGKTEKERRAACEYLVDRVLGKSTTKVADVSEDENKDEDFDIDSMIENLKREIV
ncbi:MAG: helix-turn-helix domain-containing protein [Clostridium sp.]